MQPINILFTFDCIRISTALLHRLINSCHARLHPLYLRHVRYVRLYVLNYTVLAGEILEDLGLHSANHHHAYVSKRRRRSKEV